MRRKALRSLLVGLFVCQFYAPAQEKPHFYDVDKEVTLKGKVEEIVLEPRYENRANFLILIVKSEEGGDYVCEISPFWFFNKDFHQGEHLTLVGSLSVDQNGTNHLIARQLKFQGEMMVLRDKNGFPSWRGGNRNAKPKRRRKRF
jgi:hypothetical protein